MTPEPIPVHPAYLFVPAVRPEFAAKAAASGASAVIVDLEDSVPTSRKAEARTLLSTALAGIHAAGLTACVRVNNEPALLDDDLAAAAAAKADVVVLPKAEDPRAIAAVAATLTAAESATARPISLELQIETALGLQQAFELAPASDRVVAMMLGTEDFSTALDIDPDDPDTDLTWAHGRVLLAARAAGVTPYGILERFSDFTDIAAYEIAARRSRAFGYLGTYCIHPRQVDIALAEYGVTAEQVNHAHRVLEAYAAAEAEGRSAVAFEGRMVDRPVAERARRLLARATRTPVPSQQESSA
ncbi:CoA ester lyase [uncultured Serinicoccus sp.]|uniref:HpcH/HpaI aldolase/citrate lyase family protein n=1 Tax=uncultured Serinicoccus sp. TaxID=735514 RepID=UPI002625D9DC|nr:CoA ester lyase [uncultured Serinicoccus sp.]